MKRHGVDSGAESESEGGGVPDFHATRTRWIVRTIQATARLIIVQPYSSQEKNTPESIFPKIKISQAIFLFLKSTPQRYEKLLNPTIFFSRYFWWFENYLYLCRRELVRFFIPAFGQHGGGQFSIFFYTHGVGVCSWLFAICSATRCSVSKRLTSCWQFPDCASCTAQSRSSSLAIAAMRLFSASCAPLLLCGIGWEMS